MSSTLAWLDHSDDERRRVLDVIDMFRERSTLDELGLGSIRDGIADVLFPGTSTIQTRARYFLLIPWVYRDVARRHAGSPGFSERARAGEIKLIDPLAASDDSDGAIGKQARQSLRRLPSDVYWAGLRTWGVRVFPGSREQFHRRLERAAVLAVHTGSEGDDPTAGVSDGWHPGLPAPPDGFPRAVSLRLSLEDSDYLTERILASVPGSLLAFLVKEGDWQDRVSFVWEHPQRDDFPATLRELVEHGQRFSEFMLGAPLLYNVLLARKARNEDFEQGHRDDLANWSQLVTSRASELDGWNRDRFWQIVDSTPAQVKPPTRRFVNAWLDLLAAEGPDGIAANPRAERLVHHRETEVKGVQARLENERALQQWGGSSGTAQLDFRWDISQRLVLDILEGRNPA